MRRAGAWVGGKGFADLLFIERTSTESQEDAMKLYSHRIGNDEKTGRALHVDCISSSSSVP